MKCPNCFKEINEDVAFCKYCGQAIVHQESIQEEYNQDPVNEEIQTLQESTELGAQQANHENISPKKKKRIGLKILLIFSVIALIGGATLGYLTAKGIVDLSHLLQEDGFSWTDSSEAESDELENSLEEGKNKGETPTPSDLVS